MSYSFYQKKYLKYKNKYHNLKMKGGGIVKAIDLQIDKMYIFKNLKLKTSELNGIFKGRKDKDITRVYTFLDNMNKPFEIILEDDELFEEMDDSEYKLLLESKYKTKDTICLDEHFKQHKGECWNDSIQYTLAFTDNIKESVQRKLFNLTPYEIIRLAELNNRDYLIPLYMKDINGKLDEKYKTHLLEYLQNYKDRLLIYEQRSKLNPSTNLYMMQEIKRQDTMEISIDSAIAGLQISDMVCEKKENHGGSNAKRLNLLMLLSYVFLEDNESLIYYFNLDDIEIKKIDCVFISYPIKNSSHATALLTCNKNSIYYDDNISNTNINMELYLNNIKDKNNSKIIYKDSILKKYLPGYKNNLTNKYFNIDNIEINKSEIEIESDNIIFTYIIKEKITEETYNDKYNNILLLIVLELKKSIEIIKKILDNGANVNYTGINKITPLITALLYKNSILVIELLLDTGANVNYCINKITPLIFILSSTNSIEIIPDCTQSKIRVIQLLLDTGADVNYESLNKYTPLMFALQYNNTIEIIGLLLDYGANVNHMNVNKITPLIVALKYNKSIEIIGLLLDTGANVNHEDNNKRTPLMFALKFNNIIEIIRLLLDTGANIHHLNSFNETPLMVALQVNVSIEIRQLLEERAKLTPKRNAWGILNK
jgi:ankyrin repeat protein